MSLKLIVVSVLTLFLLNSCTPKTEYIQPDLPILPYYYVKSINTIKYETRKAGNIVEVVLSPDEFDRTVNWIKKSSDANSVLNAQIRKYNKYAKGINDGTDK